MKLVEARLAALLTALVATAACAPVDELRFRFENACAREINLDMKYQHERDHEARVWNNTVVQRDQTIDKDVMVARLETFVVTYWVWYDDYEYKSETVYQPPPAGFEEISVSYLEERPDGACRFLEQAR